MMLPRERIDGEAGRDEARPYGMMALPVSGEKVHDAAKERIDGEAGRDEARPYGIISQTLMCVMPA
jgi:hypothetical protein